MFVLLSLFSSIRTLMCFLKIVIKNYYQILYDFETTTVFFIKLGSLTFFQLDRNNELIDVQIDLGIRMRTCVLFSKELLEKDNSI